MNQQPLAFIHPEARIASDVEIGPFVTIHKNVEIGEGTRILSNVTIMDGARIGKNVTIFPGAVIAGIPQDLKFKGEDTLAIIGDNTTIRECVTVNRATASKGRTVIGKNCLIMAYVHVAHDCTLGNNVILGNSTQLAGEIEIDDWAILSGGVLVHQFTRVGSHVMVQGGSRFGKDIPPYITAGREPVTFAGVNSIGLRRRGYTNEQIRDIQDIYRLLFQSSLNLTQALEKMDTELPDTEEKRTVMAFLKGSQRGIIRGYLDN